MARKQSKPKTRDTTTRAEAQTAVIRAARTATDLTRIGRGASALESWNADSVVVVQRLSESMDRFLDTFFGLAMPWRWAPGRVSRAQTDCSPGTGSRGH